MNSAATMRERLGPLDLPRVQIERARRPNEVYLALRYEEALTLVRALLRTRAVYPARLRALVATEHPSGRLQDEQRVIEGAARAIATRRLWVHLRPSWAEIGSRSDDGASDDEMLREPSPETAPAEGIDVDFDLIDDDESHLEFEMELESEDEPRVTAESSVEDDDDPHVETEAVIEDNDAD